METTETRPELFVVHRLRAGRQRGRQSKRWSDYHEQHGQIESAATRFLIIRVVNRIIKTTWRNLFFIRYQNYTLLRFEQGLFFLYIYIYIYRAKDLRRRNECVSRMPIA